MVFPEDMNKKIATSMNDIELEEAIHSFFVSSDFRNILMSERESRLFKQQYKPLAQTAVRIWEELHNKKRKRILGWLLKRR